MDVYPLMISAIKKLEEGYDSKIITNILELKYLNYIGINLNLDECVSCGSSKVVTISLQRGGYICSNCRGNEVIVDEKVIKLMRLYYYVDISKISNLDIDKSVSTKINEIISEYYDLYSGVASKSKDFLNKLEEYD
jgi:DNA repair protein RecO (recombination protein O)